MKFIQLLLLLAIPCSLMAQVPFTKHDDIVFATQGEHELKLDIYVPETGKKSYPVIVIWHGGGWLVNDESPMNQMSEYLVSQGEYVVCNMNYRLLPDQNNTVTMDKMIEDAFGGLLWVKHNISRYGGDPNRVGITGDSAGGHLVSMILNQGRNLSSSGFTDKNLSFKPSWLPPKKTAEQVAMDDGLSVQAAVLSYAALDIEAAAKGGFETPQNFFWHWARATPRGIFGEQYNVTEHPQRYRAVSPLFSIPTAKEYKLPPQFHHVGSIDQTTKAEDIEKYIEKLKAAGQQVEYHVFNGFNHAYMDSGCIEALGSCFETHAIPALKLIVPFFDKHLKPQKSQ